MNKPKYEYGLHCWGGFWNDHNVKRHGIPEFTYKWFDTKEERDAEVKLLREIEEEQANYLTSNGKGNDSIIVISLFEGYDARIKTIAHRVTRLKETGEEFYSTYDLGYCYPIGAAEYIMEWKWTPGCNDDTVIDDEKDLDKIEIVREWITGSYDLIRENE